MTIYKLRNIELSISLIGLNYRSLASEQNNHNTADSFYYSEAQILPQSLPVDSHLEQICKIY